MKKTVNKDVIILALQSAIRNCEARIEEANAGDSPSSVRFSLEGKLSGLMEALNIVRGI